MLQIPDKYLKQRYAKDMQLFLTLYKLSQLRSAVTAIKAVGGPLLAVIALISSVDQLLLISQHVPTTPSHPPPHHTLSLSPSPVPTPKCNLIA